MQIRIKLFCFMMAMFASMSFIVLTSALADSTTVTSTGIKFPDGTTQTTAASGGASSFWSQSGSNIYYNSGNVGIGTTSPETMMHIKDEINNPIVFVDARPSGSNDAMITFHTGGRAVSMGLEDGGEGETLFHITNGDRNLDNDVFLLTICQ